MFYHARQATYPAGVTDVGVLLSLPEPMKPVVASWHMLPKALVSLRGITTGVVDLDLAGEVLDFDIRKHGDRLEQVLGSYDAADGECELGHDSDFVEQLEAIIAWACSLGEHCSSKSVRDQLQTLARPEQYDFELADILSAASR
ncbi:MAG: hypothetical protein JRG93_19130 [Deltaproteobacteria bacterium]|nr:hypothetical protein [Deltaproteobacteria bacterium]